VTAKATPIPSPLPRPVKNTAQEQYDALLRPQAALLYPVLKKAGSAGVSWTEAWNVLTAQFTDVVTGKVVVYLRAHGVGVVAYYEGGETRFKLDG